MRRKAKESMGNQISTSVHGPGERREAGGVVKCSNGLPQKSQPRLKGGVGCTSSSASSTNPAHTSTGIRRMRPVTYKVPPLHCRHVRTCSYGAHLCKTLSYKKLDRARTCCSVYSKPNAGTYSLEFTDTQHSVLNPHTVTCFLHPKSDFGGEQDGSVGKGPCCCQDCVQFLGFLRRKERILSASWPPRECYVTHTTPTKYIKINRTKRKATLNIKAEPSRHSALCILSISRHQKSPKEKPKSIKS